MLTREPCGCAHDGRTWMRWCGAHLAEFQERHNRALKEKARADLVGWYSLSGPTESEVVTSNETDIENT